MDPLHTPPKTMRQINSQKTYIYSVIFHLPQILDNPLFHLKMENATNVSPYQLPTSEGCCLPSPFFQWHTRYMPSSVQEGQTWTWAESGRLCCVGNNGPTSAGDAEDAAAGRSSGDARETPAWENRATQLGSRSHYIHNSHFIYSHSGKFLKLSVIGIPTLWPFYNHFYVVSWYIGNW